MPDPEVGAPGATLPAVQTWYRGYAANLAISFESSGRIEHALTKGETRQDQVFDMLALVLPTLHTLARRVVILSADGAQSRSFDGALIDRSDWPLLYSTSGTVAVMVESVLTALEVKSALAQEDIQDIFEKTASLHQLRVGFPSASGPVAPVSAFAYECSNLSLTYFDFAAASVERADAAPREICVLNRGILCHADVHPGRIVPAYKADRQSVPTLLMTESDSLLLYVYLLCRWSGGGVTRSDLFRRYSEQLYAGVRAFHLDRDFLEILRSDPGRRARARKSFERKPDRPIGELYRDARERLGLEAA